MLESPVDDVAQVAPEAVRLRAALKRYVARRVPAGDVDDVLQDVFLNLAKSQPQTSIENITAYVFRIAANLVLARGRRPQWRYVPEDVLTDMPDGGASVWAELPEELLPHAERRPTAIAPHNNKATAFFIFLSSFNTLM